MGEEGLDVEAAKAEGKLVKVRVTAMVAESEIRVAAGSIVMLVAVEGVGMKMHIGKPVPGATYDRAAATMLKNVLSELPEEAMGDKIMSIQTDCAGATEIPNSEDIGNLPARFDELTGKSSAQH